MGLLGAPSEPPSGRRWRAVSTGCSWTGAQAERWAAHQPPGRAGHPRRRSGRRGRGRRRLLVTPDLPASTRAAATLAVGGSGRARRAGRPHRGDRRQGTARAPRRAPRGRGDDRGRSSSVGLGATGARRRRPRAAGDAAGWSTRSWRVPSSPAAPTWPTCSTCVRDAPPRSSSRRRRRRCCPAETPGAVLAGPDRSRSRPCCLRTSASASMLGDTGANALGAAWGVAAASALGRRGLLAATATRWSPSPLASERVSFSEVIERRRCCATSTRWAAARPLSRGDERPESRRPPPARRLAGLGR